MSRSLFSRADDCTINHQRERERERERAETSERDGHVYIGDYTGWSKTWAIGQ